jgi:hypothetical protein
LIVIVDVYNSYLYSVIGDSLWYHDGEKFSTQDHDNDKDTILNCAVDRQGAWWYGACGAANLNGEYGGLGVYGKTYNIWFEWDMDRKSIKESLIMVRPK